VDWVKVVVGLGATFRGWVATFHRETSVAFLLHDISSFISLLFSIKLVDPLAILFFIMNIAPFLVCLEASLHGL